MNLSWYFRRFYSRSCLIHRGLTLPCGHWLIYNCFVCFHSFVANYWTKRKPAECRWKFPTTADHQNWRSVTFFDWLPNYLHLSTQNVLLVVTIQRIRSRCNAGLPSNAWILFRIDGRQMRFTLARRNWRHAAVRAMYNRVRKEPQDDPQCHVLCETEQTKLKFKSAFRDSALSSVRFYRGCFVQSCCRLTSTRGNLKRRLITARWILLSTHQKANGDDQQTHSDYDVAGRCGAASRSDRQLVRK